MSGDKIARCELCGEPMPEGEEMFKYHGYSGNCPKPPLPKKETPRTEAATDFTAPEKLRDLCRQLERELTAACEERDSLREVLDDKRRLTRELDVALHGEEGAAKQASLCDLIVPAQRLRDERDRAMTDAATFASKWHDEEKRADEAVEERDRYKADSKMLDYLVANFRSTLLGTLARDCPEHLRKKLETTK